MTTYALIICKIIFWLCFSATIYTYFIYPALLFFVGRMRHRNQTPLPEQELPSVTMIVCAYNEEGVIADKIANCRTLDYPSHKLTFVVGSDGSSDHTPDILRAAADDRIRVIINPQRRGKVSLVNQLIHHAHSDIVVFSDANTMYQPDAVRELVQPFVDEKVGCVIGKLELVTGGNRRACATEGLYWRYENCIKKLESDLGIVPTVNGGMFAIRSELFAEITEKAVTEDQVLGMTIMTQGHRCVFKSTARAQETVSTFSGELRRRIRISAGNFQSLFLVPQILSPKSGWVSFAFISHKLLRWFVPFFLLGMLTANVVIAGTPFYGAAMLAQAAFYLAGILGALCAHWTTLIKPFAVPRYFLAMNIAILIGLLRFLTRRQRVTWAKAPR